MDINSFLNDQCASLWSIQIASTYACHSTQLLVRGQMKWKTCHPLVSLVYSFFFFCKTDAHGGFLSASGEPGPAGGLGGSHLRRNDGDFGARGGREDRGQSSIILFLALDELTRFVSIEKEDTEEIGAAEMTTVIDPPEWKFLSRQRLLIPPSLETYPSK